MPEEVSNEVDFLNQSDESPSGIYDEIRAMQEADKIAITGNLTVVVDNDESHGDYGLFDGVGGFFKNLFKNPLAGIFTGVGTIAVVVVVLLLVRRKR